MRSPFPAVLLGVLGLAFSFPLSVASEPLPLCSNSEARMMDKHKDALEAALALLKLASGREDLDKRKDALDVVVDLGNPAALDPLLFRLVTASASAASAEEDLDEGQILVERKRVQLAEMRLSLERNNDLKGEIKKFERQLRQLEQKMMLSRSKADLEGPWRDALRGGLNRLLMGQAAGKRRAMIKALWKTFEKGEDSTSRLAAAQLLEDLGESGSTGRFARVMISALEQRTKLTKGSSELERALRKWDRKLQEEVDQIGGNTNGTVAAYNRIRSQAGDRNRELLLLERFARSLSVSAGRTLSGDPEAGVSVAIVMKLARKSAYQEQLIDVLIHSGRDEAKAALVAELSIAKGDLFKRVLVDALSRMGAKAEAEPWLLSSGLAAESWLVQSHSVGALANLRSRDAVPLLIEMLDGQDGRLRSDISAALASLTGTDFHGNSALWRRWWQDNGASFEVSLDLPGTGDSKALESVGMTFFGLSTESQKVLFVLDVSGSMDFLMKNYTSGSTGEKRIVVAKRELLGALSGIPNGGTFNIVLYASDVWTWSDTPVMMNDSSRSEATKFVKSIKPNGGTNIFGSLKLALGRARGKTKKKARSAPRWVPPVYDTIFLLTDGQPSVGVSTARNDILDMAAAENADLGVQINTIGLSTDQDAVLMRRLAEQSGGQYVAR